MPTFTANEILQQLDKCARKFTFPMLDNGYVYLADTRLNVWRDETRWALIIEVLGANYRAGEHDSIENCLYCFGNCLKRPPGIANEDFLYVTSNGLEGPTFDEEYGWLINQGVKTIKIRQQIIAVDLDLENMSQKGIELINDPEITGADLLRSLVLEQRELLLATEEELRERVPHDLPLILRLDKWHHPDLANEELPSQSETFRLISRVLEIGDKSLYRPTLNPNTHWRNWPEGGTL